MIPIIIILENKLNSYNFNFSNLFLNTIGSE
jgi:hypothetical protein